MSVLSNFVFAPLEIKESKWPDKKVLSRKGIISDLFKRV